MGTFHQHVLTLIPAWICNYTLRKVWVEITNPFPNLNGTIFLRKMGGGGGKMGLGLWPKIWIWGGGTEKKGKKGAG